MKIFLIILLSLSINVSGNYPELINEVDYQIDLAISNNPDLYNLKDQLFKEAVTLVLSDPRLEEKGLWTEAGRAIGGAIVGEIVHRIINRVTKPRPRKPRKPSRPQPPQRGVDPGNGGPTPVGHPSPGV